MPPQVNAVVTLITGAGNPGDPWGDDTDTPGVEKFTGEAPAYYREVLDRVIGDNSVNILERAELILDTADLDAMNLDTDDVITYRVAGEAEDRTGTASSIRRARLHGIPRALQTARVILADR
jgi:hypothetical protein